MSAIHDLYQRAVTLRARGALEREASAREHAPVGDAQHHQHAQGAAVLVLGCCRCHGPILGVGEMRSSAASGPVRPLIFLGRFCAPPIFLICVAIHSRDMFRCNASSSRDELVKRRKLEGVGSVLRPPKVCRCTLRAREGSWRHLAPDASRQGHDRASDANVRGCVDLFAASEARLDGCNFFLVMTGGLRTGTPGAQLRNYSVTAEVPVPPAYARARLRSYAVTGPVRGFRFIYPARVLVARVTGTHAPGLAVSLPRSGGRWCVGRLARLGR